MEPVHVHHNRFAIAAGDAHPREAPFSFALDRRSPLRGTTGCVGSTPRSWSRGVAAIALLVGLVPLAACGSGSGSSTPVSDPVVQAIAAEMAADEGDMLLGDRGDAECVAQKTVDGFGAGRLAELGIDVNAGFAEGDLEELGLATAEIEDLFGFLGDCVDLSANLAQGIANNGTLTGQQASCVGDGLGEDRIEEWQINDTKGEDTDAFWDVVEVAYRDCDINR